MSEDAETHGTAIRGDVGRTAAYAALTWAAYALVESYLAVGLPLLMRHAVVTHFKPGASVETGFVSPLVTAIALCVYPLIGALAGGLAVILYLRINGFVRKGDSVAISEDAGRQLGCASLSAAIVLYQVCTRNEAAMPTTVIVGVLMIVYRFVLPGPVATALILVGVPFLAQPRSLTPTTTILLAAAYATGVLVAGLAFRRLRRGRLWPTWMRRLSVPVPAVLIGLSCLVLAANLAVERRPTPSESSVAARSGDHRPNVILISLDTVRADHLSVYGYGRDTTPNLKRFAAASTVFTRALATSNYTLPSHASMLTGLNPVHHGARDAHQAFRVGYPISPRATTVAEVLAREGYVTGAVVANFAYLLPEFGFARGFASFRVIDPASIFRRTARSYLLREFVADLLRGLFLKDASRPYERGEGVTTQARQFLDARAGRQPFFLFVNYMDAHHPYRPPDPYDKRFPGKDPSFKWTGFSALVDGVSAGSRHLSESERQHLLSQYDGALAYLDDQLERVFGHLRSLGVFDNSLIIVTSDHGEAFDENGIMLHGTSLFDHQIRVPLIVKYPNSSVGATSDVAVSGADIMPTILDVVGVSAVAPFDGRSMRHLDPADTRPVISESYKPRPFQGTWDGHLTEVALSSGTMKLIVRVDGREELYDLVSDPEERTSLVGRRAVPQEWTAMLGQVLREASRLADPSVGLDPLTEERLRSLGYIR